jgi:hypothetical protein
MYFNWLNNELRLCGQYLPIDKDIGASWLAIALSFSWGHVGNMSYFSMLSFLPETCGRRERKMDPASLGDAI